LVDWDIIEKEEKQKRTKSKIAFSVKEIENDVNFIF
jgi:hypothetical protein